MKTTGCTPAVGCLIVMALLVLGGGVAVFLLAPMSSEIPDPTVMVDKLKEITKAANDSPASGPFERGRDADACGDLDAALDAYNQALELDPIFADAYISRALVHNNRGDYILAVADYEAGLALKPDDASANNNYAWFLATCPQDYLRDGARAVELATKACTLTEWKNPANLDTLAAAYAEAKDFDLAVTWQQKAINIVQETSAPDPVLLLGFTTRLNLYQNKKPYREKAGK